MGIPLYNLFKIDVWFFISSFNFVRELDNVKDSFCKEQEHVLNKFPKYHMKILLGDFSIKVGRVDIFNWQLGTKVYTKLVMIMELE
jgi:hypothetical protein